MSPMERLTAKADRLAESRANLEKIVEAAKPLYESLGDEQKHKFITLGRALVPERGSFAKEMRRLVEGRAISTTRLTDGSLGRFALFAGTVLPLSVTGRDFRL